MEKFPLVLTNGKLEITKYLERKDAKYGMYRYKVSFAFRVKKTGEETQTFRSYDAELLIRHASDGKKYLYDIVKIKENTDDVIDLQKTETRLAAMNAASQSSVSDDRIQQNSTDVNGESKKSICFHPLRFGRAGQSRPFAGEPGTNGAIPSSTAAILHSALPNFPLCPCKSLLMFYNSLKEQ